MFGTRIARKRSRVFVMSSFSAIYLYWNWSSFKLRSNLVTYICHKCDSNFWTMYLPLNLYYIPIIVSSLRIITKIKKDNSLKRYIIHKTGCDINSICGAQLKSSAQICLCLVCRIALARLMSSYFRLSVE